MYRITIKNLQRKIALRIIRDDRTISLKATQELVGVIPIVLLVQKTFSMYKYDLSNRI